MAVLVAAVAALLPLVIAPGLVFYFDITPKVAVLLIGAAIGAALFAARPQGLSALLATSGGRWLAVLLGAGLIVLAASTLWSTNPALSLNGSSWRRFGLVTHGATLIFTFVAACWLASDPARAPLVLLRAVSASGAAASIYGIAQYFGIDPFLPASAYRVGEGVWTIVRPPGTLGHAAYFAGYLVTVVFSGAGLALADHSRAWRRAGTLTCVLASIAVALTGTRAAMLGVAAGATLLLALRRPTFSKRLAAACVVVAALAAVFYYSPAGERLRARVRWSREDALGGARLLLWRDSLRMAAGRPLTGYGPETFATEFPRFQSVALARAYPDFYLESAHNAFLDAFTASGAAGFAIVAGLAALGLLATFRARKHPLAAAVGAGLAASLITHQFECFILPTALFFYLMTAVLVSIPARKPVPPVPLRLWAVAAAIPLIAAFVFFAARLLWADHLLARTGRVLDRGQLAEAVRLYGRSSALGHTADLWFSRRLVLFAQRSPQPGQRLLAWQKGIETAERATRTAEDRHNAFYSLAGFYAAQNDFARTEASLRAAIGIAPNWFKPHWTLAQALRLAGRLDEAEREAVLAAELNAGKNAEVGATLSEIRAARSLNDVNPK